MYSNTLLMRLMYSGFMDDVIVRVVPKLAGVVEFPKGCVSGWLCPARETLCRSMWRGAAMR